MAFGHLLLCNWLPAFYFSSFPCFASFRLFFKVVLSLAHSGDEEEAYHQRAMPEGPPKEERGRKQRSLSLRLFYILVEAIVVALSPAARDAPRNGGKWEGKEGREVGSVRFPRSTERRWDDASDVGRLSVGRSTVALRRASPVSLPRRGGGISLARSACNVAIKSRIFLRNGALTHFLMHAMALRKLHSPVLHYCRRRKRT